MPSSFKHVLFTLYIVQILHNGSLVSLQCYLQEVAPSDKLILLQVLLEISADPWILPPIPSDFISMTKLDPSQGDGRNPTYLNDASPCPYNNTMDGPFLKSM